MWKRMFVLLTLLLIARPAAAVVISQVLYAPSGTDSGGEAVELYNEADAAADISGWKIDTEKAAADATIPNGTVLQSKSRYLITDVNWSILKDDKSWRNADYEEVITMYNSDSGVALKDAFGNAVDAVGWGNASEIAEGLYKGTPAAVVAKGNSLQRIKYTGDNAADFIEALADFSGGSSIPVKVNVSEENISVVEKVWLSSYKPQSKLTVYAKANTTMPVVALFEGRSYDMFANASEYYAVIDVASAAPGNYTVTVVTGDSAKDAMFEVIAVKSLEILGSGIEVNAKAGREEIVMFSVKNSGNVAFELQVSSKGLFNGNSSIKNIKYSIDASSYRQLDEQPISSGVQLLPGITADVKLAILPPRGIKPGVYTGKVYVSAV